MAKEIDMIHEYFEYVEQENTKIAKRVYNNVLNPDKLGSIIYDEISKVFWLEATTTMNEEYMYYYLIEHVRTFLREYFNDDEIDWLFNVC